MLRRTCLAVQDTIWVTFLIDYEYRVVAPKSWHFVRHHVIDLTAVAAPAASGRRPEGRLFALGLMRCGIALLGVVTAGLASWLLEKISDTD